ERLLHERADAIVVVAEPARGRDVRGVSRALEGGLSLVAPGAARAEELQGVIGRHDVADMSEVETRDQLLRREGAEQSPEREARMLGPEVPEGVQHCRRGKVHDTLLRAEPA